MNKQRIARFLLAAACLGGSTAHAQTYLHPTAGVQNTNSGACVVATGSGTYYDNGGAGSNYAANIPIVYRTFCPSTAGTCLRATFTGFSMNDTYFLCSGPNSCCDYLTIRNGPSDVGPPLYSNCTVSPGIVTSTDPSGCLTFDFTSDGTVQLGGWAATLSNVACASGPSGNDNSDCEFATPLCAAQSTLDASAGPGIVAEGCNGCNLGEAFTNWYRIQILTGGTLEFTIDPNANSNDFDPALYGPNATCGTLGTPVRCSYAGVTGTGDTGLGNGAVDTSEDILGDGFVSPLNVTAGEVYYLLINGKSAASGNNGYTLTWAGTAELDCVITPVELLGFSVD